MAFKNSFLGKKKSFFKQYVFCSLNSWRWNWLFIFLLSKAYTVIVSLQACFCHIISSRSLGLHFKWRMWHDLALNTFNCWSKFNINLILWNAPSETTKRKMDYWEICVPPTPNLLLACPLLQKVLLREQQMDRLPSDYGMTDNAEQAELQCGNLLFQDPQTDFFKIYSISQVINMIYGAGVTVSETTKGSGGSSPKEMLSGVFCCACNAVSMQL